MTNKQAIVNNLIKIANDNTTKLPPGNGDGVVMPSWDIDAMRRKEEETAAQAVRNASAAELPTYTKALLGGVTGLGLGGGSWLVGNLVDEEYRDAFGNYPKVTPAQYLATTAANTGILGAAGYRLASQLGLGKKGKIISALAGGAIPHLTANLKPFQTTRSGVLANILLNTAAPAAAGAYLAATLPSKGYTQLE